MRVEVTLMVSNYATTRSTINPSSPACSAICCTKWVWVIDGGFERVFKTGHRVSDAIGPTNISSEARWHLRSSQTRGCCRNASTSPHWHFTRLLERWGRWCEGLSESHLLRISHSLREVASKDHILSWCPHTPLSMSRVSGGGRKNTLQRLTSLPHMLSGSDLLWISPALKCFQDVGRGYLSTLLRDFHLHSQPTVIYLEPRSDP